MPGAGTLAAVWEENAEVRMAMRAQGKMLRWPSPETTGVASLASLSLNRSAVCDAISILGPCMDEPKPPCVDWLKAEAGMLQNSLEAFQVKQLYALLNMELKPVHIYLDAWGVRRLFCLSTRKWKTPMNNFRDPWLLSISKMFCPGPYAPLRHGCDAGALGFDARCCPACG